MNYFAVLKAKGVEQEHLIFSSAYRVAIFNVLRTAKLGSIAIQNSRLEITIAFLYWKHLLNECSIKINRRIQNTSSGLAVSLYFNYQNQSTSSNNSKSEGIVKPLRQTARSKKDHLISIGLVAHQRRLSIRSSLSLQMSFDTFGQLGRASQSRQSKQIII